MEGIKEGDTVIEGQGKRGRPGLGVVRVGFVSMVGRKPLVVVPDIPGHEHVARGIDGDGHPHVIQGASPTPASRDREGQKSG